MLPPEVEFRHNDVLALGDPGSFDLEPGDPMYWTERLSYELSMNLRQLVANDYEFQQSRSDSLKDMYASYADYASSAYSWVNSAIAALKAGETPEQAPQPPTSMGVLPSLEAVALQFGLLNIQMTVNIFNSLSILGSAETTEIVEQLTAIKENLATGLITEINSVKHAWLEQILATGFICSCDECDSCCDWCI